MLSLKTMFTWFSKTKLRYDKGQLAPVFIVVLVIVMIMAMVTINLSKVSLIKTDSANAVDSGALAGGSVMANVFNSVAKTNADMVFWYWTFYTSVLVSYVIAYAALINAAADACSNCDALAHINTAIFTMFAIVVAVTAYWLAQWFFYRSIREMGTQGRENAIKIAHRFTFMNSGIGSKLKEGTPPSDISDGGDRYNYREEFSNFLNNNIGSDASYAYSWRDGEARAHSANSAVSVNEVDTFSLRVTAMPFPVITGLLAVSIVLSYVAKIFIGMACIPVPVTKWACAAAIGVIIATIILMLSTQVGLLPGGTVTSNSDSDALPYIICWIEDIVHDRRFRVDTNQNHEGADLGLWQTRYPNTHSYSVVDFRGDGRIYPATEDALKHDASMVETDR